MTKFVYIQETSRPLCVVYNYTEDAYTHYYDCLGDAAALCSQPATCKFGDDIPMYRVRGECVTERKRESNGQV